MCHTEASLAAVGVGGGLSRHHAQCTALFPTGHQSEMRGEQPGTNSKGEQSRAGLGNGGENNHRFAVSLEGSEGWFAVRSYSLSWHLRPWRKEAICYLCTLVPNQQNWIRHVCNWVLPSRGESWVKQKLVRGSTVLSHTL